MLPVEHIWDVFVHTLSLQLFETAWAGGMATDTEGNNPSNNRFLCPGVVHASILAGHGPDSDPFFL